MKKRYKVPIIDEDGHESNADVTFDTDEKKVEILTNWNSIEMSFDTIKQLNTQLDDVLRFNGK